MEKFPHNVKWETEFFSSWLYTNEFQTLTYTKFKNTSTLIWTQVRHIFFSGFSDQFKPYLAIFHPYTAVVHPDKLFLSYRKNYVFDSTLSRNFSIWFFMKNIILFYMKH